MAESVWESLDGTQMADFRHGGEVVYEGRKKWLCATCEKRLAEIVLSVPEFALKTALCAECRRNQAHGTEGDAHR